MYKKIIFAACILACLPLAFISCNPAANANTPATDSTGMVFKFNGYESQAKWGEHLVTLGGCNDCHTPKKMGPQGPEDDSSLSLSGHPAQMPPPDIDRKMVEAKHFGVTTTQTVWVGPWGISYAANLTSDSTGIGNWKEEQFIKCIREGKWMGLDNTRPLLPPMPWRNMRLMTDDELKAIFAYLKSTKPVHNNIPVAAPPLSAMR